MRAETQRAITTYPFDHPENIHLSHSSFSLFFLSYPLFLSLPLSGSLLSLLRSNFPRVSLPFHHPIFIQIHWEAPPHEYSQSARYRRGALLLSTFARFFSFSPSFSINSEFYLVCFAPCHCLVSLYLRVLPALKPSTRDSRLLYHEKIPHTWSV